MTFASRSKVVPSLLLGSLVTALLLITPAAHAQLPNLDDSVGNVVDSVGSAAEVAGDTVVGTVDDSTSVVTKDGEDDGGLIGGVVDTVNGVAGTANETIKKTVETVEDTSEEVVKDLQGTLKGKPRSDSFNSNGDVRTVDNNGSPRKERDGSREIVKGKQVASPSRLPSSAGQGPMGILNLRPTVPPTSEVSAPGGFSEIVRQAAEATKKLAFPLALSLLVVAYLMLQGRIDRKDPKLAFAPMDAEQDLLSFR